MEINLNNPIFVYNFDITNLPRQSADRIFCDLSDMMSKYTNITFWIVPNSYTKVECVYDGSFNKNKISKIFECLKQLMDPVSYSNFSKKMREILIDDIFDETN